MPRRPSRWTLTARWIFPVAGPPLQRGAVTIAGERIAAVEAAGRKTADVDLGEAAILPGLVNAHTHLDLSGARGQCPPTPDFTQWLRQVIAFRRGRTAEQVRDDIGRGIREAVRSGTTLLGDIAADGESLPLLEKGPCRALVFFEILGLTDERLWEQAHKLNAWWAAHDRSPCRLGVSPHAPYSVHKDFFMDLRLGMADGPCAVHLAETRAELELLTERQGPFVSFLQEIGVWHPAGLATSLDEVLHPLRNLRTLLIHGNYLTGQEGISPRHTIVYCPRTHAAFGHPPHPFREFLQRGVRVALGTDSLASNADLDLLAEARFLRQRHPDFPGADLLRVATLAGAEALGWADETGSLAPGKSADLLVLPLPNVDTADPHELIFDSEQKVQRVMIRGRWVVGNGLAG